MLTREPEPRQHVRHTDGGRGTIVIVRLEKAEALIEWEDLSRTWERFKDLEGPLQ